jgi:hypothetical protein
MVMSHLTLYYLWISWKYYDAALLYPSSFADFMPWAKQMWAHVVTGAAPNQEAFITYWVFLFGQAVMAFVIPGLQMKGLPIKHLNGKRLVYNCNGIYTWYLLLFTFFFFCFEIQFWIFLQVFDAGHCAGTAFFGSVATDVRLPQLWTHHDGRHADAGLFRHCFVCGGCHHQDHPSHVR